MGPQVQLMDVLRFMFLCCVLYLDTIPGRGEKILQLHSQLQDCAEELDNEVWSI